MEPVRAELRELSELLAEVAARLSVIAGEGVSDVERPADSRGVIDGP